MGSSSKDHTDVVEKLSDKALMAAIIFLCFVVIFLCLYFYMKWFHHRREIPRRRLDLSAHEETEVAATSGVGLEASILKSIPIISLNIDEFKDGLECAVCLCEVCEGENARILPPCNHGFHVECIDMWLESHATCPLCRNCVTYGYDMPWDFESVALDVDDDASEDSDLPANVLFWGGEDEICIS